MKVKKLLKTTIIIAVVLFVLIAVFLIVFKSVKIAGGAMSPVYKDRDFWLVSTLSYILKGPNRGDVILYSVKDNERTIGRLVGLPGETITIKEGELIVNDELLDEPYADWTLWTENEEKEIQLQEDKYLVLFDRRSENIQVVNKSNIVGKFFYKYYSQEN
jgi:signal peptidase I